MCKFCVGQIGGKEENGPKNAQILGSCSFKVEIVEARCSAINRKIKHTIGKAGMLQVIPFLVEGAALDCLDRDIERTVCGHIEELRRRIK